MSRSRRRSTHRQSPAQSTSRATGVVPVTPPHAEVLQWSLTLRFKCECGREIDASLNGGPFHLHNGTERLLLYAPCCGRVYFVKRWDGSTRGLGPQFVRIQTHEEDDPITAQYRRLDGSFDLGSYIDDMSDDGD